MTRASRLAPLRKVVGVYAEPNDRGRLYDLLECKHSVAREEGAPERKRRRCEVCKIEAWRA